MTVFIASDIHFSHKNILKYCPRRRFGKAMPEHEDAVKDMVSRMNEEIVNNWNSVVNQEDEVYILGDVAMSIIANAPPLIRRLNGKKYLIAGNHDRTLRKLIATTSPDNDDLFVWIRDYHAMTFHTADNKKVQLFMSHFPMSHWENMNQGSCMIHGHLHGTPSGVTGRIKDVGIDTNDLFPYKLESVVKDLLKIEVIREHHQD